MKSQFIVVKTTELGVIADVELFVRNLCDKTRIEIVQMYYTRKEEVFAMYAGPPLKIQEINNFVKGIIKKEHGNKTKCTIPHQCGVEIIQKLE